VNLLRAELLKACLEMGTAPQGVFTLTAPTGTGKTLSMLSFALTHAVQHNLRRVIVVVPYLTIIEQTVREYRKSLADIVGPEEIERYILEHHSLAGIRGLGGEGSSNDQDMEDEPRRQARLLTENWDAPIIVTTSVQLLESLFSNRPSACRKLHRLASSVILFDEVQTLPVSVIIPTLATLSRLAERYRTTVVLATATQPAFAHLDTHVKTYCKIGWQPKEIVHEDMNLFGRARRTKVEWPDLDRPTSWTEIAQWLGDQNQALCVVNLKKHALRLFGELRENGIEGLFHLSTSMCPAHRQAVLKEVQERLERKEPCRLISTQCVEAGVDLDFPIVYRAFGPLDAIAQAAGRCNRNGSVPMGTVRVFLPEEERYPDGIYQQAASVTRMLLKQRGAQLMDIHNPELFNEYFWELYDVVRPQNRKPELLDAIKGQHFVHVAELYRIIEKDALNVLVPYDLDIFRQLEGEVRQTGLNRKWIAKARPYTIGLYRLKRHDSISTYLVPVPLSRGESAEDWFIYTKTENYHSDTGLVPPEGMDCLIG
jgi:CRISPR-associated helicase Cas3